MRAGFAVLVAVLALAGCSRIGADKPAPPPASVRGCVVTATAPWRPAGAGAFEVSASSAGPDCAHAVATIAIRDAAGQVLWAEAAPTAQLFGLADAHDNAAMQTALANWIESSNHTIAATSALPDWPQGAEAPQSGEFPFYPEQDLPRDEYLALRARNAPVFCYVQGMESQACVALDNGAIRKIGVQTFPG
jgi:hypothetical protein